MGKIIDSAFTTDSYYLFSQTPKNIGPDNYYIASLQEKVNADWEYRYNVVDVEQEQTIGGNDYKPMEVVIQSIKNDKGQAVSDDIAGLVFRDILYTVPLGTKFRFSRGFNLDEPIIDKNVWLAMNKYEAAPTSRIVVNRCNGTIGSIYTDTDGTMKYHYEEVVCANSLSATAFNYNNVIVSPSAQLTMVVQHNKYTKDYYINQRFIVGYDQVYKVTAIDKYNGLKTYQPESVGLVILYANLDEKSAKDDFKNRIAYNNDEYSAVNSGAKSIKKEKEVVVKKVSIMSEPVQASEYSINIVSPLPVPSDIGAEKLTLEFGLFGSDGERIVCDMTATWSITGIKVNNYVRVEKVSDSVFTIKRIRFYNRKPLIFEISAQIGEEIVKTSSFEFGLKGV